MKILVIVPTLVSYSFLRDMCLELVRQGNEVHLATSWNELGVHERDLGDIQFHLIHFPRGMNPVTHVQAARHLNLIVRDVRPDVIDVHFSAAAFTVALAKRTSWPPVLATVQGLRFPIASGIGKIILKWAECWSARRVNQFVVLTGDDYAAMQGAGVKNCYQQAAYGFGCELNKFDRANFPADKIREAANEIGNLSGQVVFTFIGRLVRFKGFHLVVRSFFEASKKLDNIRLVICGDYDAYHDSGLTEDETAAVGRHSEVVFTGWTDEVERYLSVTDVIVFPSEREGVPVNLMESLSMGVPVITCDSRGCREVMDEGRNGIVLEARSEELLTEAMIKLGSDSKLRNKYAQAALEFRRNFDRKHFVDEHIRLLGGLVSAHS